MVPVQPWVIMSAATDLSITVSLSRPTDEQALITLVGQLGSATLRAAWSQTADVISPKPPRQLKVDVSALTYCDGAGLGLFSELRRLVCSVGGTFEFVGLNEKLHLLADMATLKDPLAGALVPPTPPGLVEQVGRGTAGIFSDLYELVVFIGQLMATVTGSLLHPRTIRLHDLLTVAEKAGANAMPVISLLGLLVGLILAFQTANPLRRFGAEPLIPTIVSIAVVREMGPLITAVILAGRSGSAFAAEIGTMKVTEELAALETFGLEPIRFLVVPRVLAAMFVTPLLAIFNILMSVVGGYIVMASLGYSLRFYINSVLSAVTLSDFLGGVFKALVFGVIVAGIGCLRGMQTRSGPGAVGDSTTRAVVAGIVLTIIADAILGVLFFALGV